MVRIIPRSGRVASRVASPAMRSSEQPISNVAGIRAAISGGTTRTLYSSANSWTVSSQLAILLSPAFRNTLAIARRNRAWTIETGDRPRKAVTDAIRPRTLGGRLVDSASIRIGCPQFAWSARADHGRLWEERA